MEASTQRAKQPYASAIHQDTAISLHTCEALLRYTDEINARSIKWLDYATPEDEIEGFFMLNSFL